MMATRKIRKSVCNSNMFNRLKRQNINTCKDILSRSNFELMKMFGLTLPQVKNLVDQVSRTCVPKSSKASEMIKSSKEKETRQRNRTFFRTSLPDLDKALHGGIPVGTLTEIAGPAGCGKTQLCIMLSLLATMPTDMGGLAGRVIYIDTECAFSAARLVEMAQARFPDYFQGENCENRLLTLTENIIIDFQSSCGSLMDKLQSLEMAIISKKIRLIIVDSVASLVRKEYGAIMNHNMADRSNFLTKAAAVLKYLAESFQIHVVVTNQITTRFHSDQQTDTMQPTMSRVTSALGNTWSHSVNTRLITEYVDSIRRQVMVAKSPIAPFTSFVYTIQASGIVQEKDGANHYSGTNPSVQQIRTRSALMN